MLDKLASALDFDRQALGLRFERQKVLAGNIANADTPDFKARDFDFSKALAQASATAYQAVMKPVERSPGVDGVLATQSAPLAESVNVMSVNVPPTSIARVQVLATGAPIVDPPLAPEKTALASQPRSRLLHFSRADSSGADFRARRRFVV